MTKNTKEMMNSRSNVLIKNINELKNILKLILDDMKKIKNSKETTFYQCVKKTDDFIETCKILSMKMKEITDERVEDGNSLFDGLMNRIGNALGGGPSIDSVE